MADDRQVTPEKQLLKLIEGSGEEGQGGRPLAEARLKRNASSLLSFGALFARFSFFKRATQKKISHPPKFSLSFTLVNRVLLAAVIVLFIYVATDGGASAISLRHLPTIVPQKDRLTAGSESKVSPLKEESYYLQKVSSRDLFKEYKEADTKKEKKEMKSADENEASKNLSLVGISWSADPDVIIEDKSAQKTFFVKRGQMVGNGVKVEAVFKDKVVLSHDGQEFELR